MGSFPEGWAVRTNTIMKRVGHFDVAEKDFADWAKESLPAFHIRDLPGRRSPVKRRQPEPRLPFSVWSLQHHLAAVGRNVVIKHRKAGCQGLGLSGVQVRHPHFSWISVRSEPGDSLYTPVP